ncbi:hypothetical protein KC19_2G023300 [Ceratodon purpureus]|uniref:Uncharacterized protein n=1 Tax=Ceratodon purpureus TaxID=3225 RepID=A0A8T0ISE3_CERPU|nr:hypothetical protein KC19_2G023300 [Ceratodon purpureus]
MARTRFLCSLARVQGFGRARALSVSASGSLANKEGSRKCREYSTGALDGFSSSSGSSMSSMYSLQSSSIARHFPSGLHSRSFAAAPMKQDEINEIIEDINSKFADAREEIELAAESKETVYFNEESEIAKKAVAEVLNLFNGLLARLPESERGAIQRSMGMKMEQLKAEVAQLDE